MTSRSTSARKAWETRRKPTYRARSTTLASQRALEEWARANGWRVVLLDAKSSRPRTGIIDAVLIRLRPRVRDALDLRLVQLKGGSAGLTATEMLRLREAVGKVSTEHLVALFDGEQLLFSPAEPE